MSIKMLSVGSILLLIFFTSVIVYLCVGVMYKKAVYNSSCPDSIPNIDFWISLPGLIKDGYLFFVSPCFGNRIEHSSRPYQPIGT